MKHHPSPRRIVSFGRSLSIAQSRIYQTNAGIFVNGSDAYLIDPCVEPAEISAIRRFVETRDLNVCGIILTHAHWDHILAPGRFGSTRVIASRQFTSSIENRMARIREQIREWESSSGIERGEAFIAPSIDVEVNDGDALPYGIQTLRVYHAPGHTDDQIALYEESEHMLWAADMLSDVEIPIVEDPLIYLRSIERLMNLDVRILIPGHGTPTDDVAEIRRRFSTDHEYLTTLIDSVSRHVAEGCTIEESLSRHRDFIAPPGINNSYDHCGNVQATYETLTRIK